MWTIRSRCLAGLLSCFLCTGALYTQTYAQTDSPAAADGPRSWPNAYADSRAEQLIDSAGRSLNAGQAQAAEQRLTEALQVLRVNYGLRDHRQIQPLQLLIESLFQQHRWQAADDQIDYFQWLNQANYELDFPAYLEGSQALGDLLLRASADPANPESVRYLVAAKNLNWRTISAIEAHFGRDDPLLAPWLYRVVLNHYQQSALIRRRGLTSFNFHSDADAYVNGFRLSKNETLDMSFGIGEELLLRIETLFADDPLKRALARLQRADWQQIYGKQQQAAVLYDQALALLRDAAMDQQALAQFSHAPALIPAPGLLEQLPADDAPLQFQAWSPLYPGLDVQTGAALTGPARAENFQARLQFDLNPDTGGAQNIRILDIQPASDSFESLLRQQLQLLNFRPPLAQQTAIRKDLELRISLSGFYESAASTVNLSAADEL